MISYGVYKILHIVGIAGVILSLGGLTLFALSENGKTPAHRKLAMITHGVGLLITFVAGFGLMARIGLVSSSWPAWIYGKLAIWLLLGVSPTLIKRRPQQASVLWWAFLVLVALAAWLANYKPL